MNLLPRIYFNGGDGGGGGGTTVSSKSGGSSGTHKESGVFYRKVSPNRYHYGDDTITTADDNFWKDTALSTVFPDLYDGSTATSIVSGGADERLYLSKFTIPESEEFGDSDNLIGLKYFFYPTAVTQEQLNTYTPAYRMWNLNTPMTDEGSITPDKRNLAVFTTYMDIEKPLYGDDFSGVTTKTSSFSTTRTIQTGEPYITVSDAASNQDWLANPFKMTEDEIYTKYGSDLGGERVVYITKEWRSSGMRGVVGLGAFSIGTIEGVWDLITEPSWEAAGQVASRGMVQKAWVPINGKTWGLDIQWDDDKIKSKIKYSAQIEEDASDLLIPLESGESIFTDVYMRGNQRPSVSEGDLLKATAEIVTENALTGGQSLKLETFWNKKATPQAEAFPTSLPAPGPGTCTNRQEVTCVHELPYPQPIDAVPDVSRPLEDRQKPNQINSASNPYRNMGYTGQYWSMDFMIEEMDYNYNAGSPHNNDGDVGAIDNSAWVRGMAVTFSNTKPQSNETFFDFVSRCTGVAARDDVVNKNLKEFSYTGVKSFMGFYIGKFNWNGSDVDNGINLEHNKFSEDPILCIPYLHPEYSPNAGTNDASSATGGAGWRTSNVAFNTGNDDNPAFHQQIGDAVWFWPGSTTDTRRIDGHSHGVCELQEQRWYKAVVNFHHEEGCVLQFFDSKNDESLTLPMKLKTPKGNASHKRTGPEYYPRYVTIWVKNFPGGRMNKSAQDISHGEDADDWSSRTCVFVDRVGMWGMNNSIIENCTVTDNNKVGRSRVKIPSAYTHTWDTGWMEAATPTNPDSEPYAHGTSLSEGVQTNSYISIGFDDPGDFDKLSGLSNGTYLFFNGFKVDSNAHQALYNSASDNYIRAGFTSNSYNEPLGGQTDYSFFDHSTSPTAFRRGLQTWGSGTTGRSLIFTGDTANEYFNQKGVTKLDFNSQQVDYGEIQTEANYANISVGDLRFETGTQLQSFKRENIFVSARVMDVSNANIGTVIVDHPQIFNLPDDQEYLIFKKEWNHYKNGNAAWRNNYQVVEDFDLAPTRYSCLKVKVSKRNGNEITFNKDVRFSSYGHQIISDGTYTKYQLNKLITGGMELAGLCHERTKNNILISPLKYWLIIEAYNNDGTAGQAGASRSYASIATVNKGESSFPASTNYGVTYSEHKFTDTPIPTNVWSLAATNESSTVETQTDYGYGIMDDNNPSGGYVSQFIPKDKDLLLAIDSSPIIEKGNYNVGDALSTLLVPKDMQNASALTIGTSDNKNTVKLKGSNSTKPSTWLFYKRPYALLKYKDELPTIEDFKVEPDEDNPSFPKFTWKCSDDDIWYGFIIIDKKVPENQYHNAFLHVPMNTPIPSNETSGINWPPTSSDSQYNIFDYVNNNHNYYGYVKRPEGETPIQFISMSENVGSPYNFLDPEGLSGYCHNFTYGDSLPLDAHEASDLVKGYKEEGDVFSASVIIRPSDINDEFKSHKRRTIFKTEGAGAGGIHLKLGGDRYIYAHMHFKGTGRGVREINEVILKSHSVVLENKPMNIIVTFDKYLKSGNMKLFINGKLEDLTGKAYIGSAPPLDDTNHWEWNRPIHKANAWSIFHRVYVGDEAWKGRMEELVFYQDVIYPINPHSGEFTLTTPLPDSDDDGRPQSYFGKIFIKDYHNIRGTTSKEVATTPHTIIHKVGLGI